MELALHNVVKLIPRRKLENILTGRCSNCDYLFTMNCKDLGIVNEDTIVVCPKCGHREHLQNK
jgi:DNA-directed RNA polymerase subunit RPC12/RpoP